MEIAENLVARHLFFLPTTARYLLECSCRSVFCSLHQLSNGRSLIHISAVRPVSFQRNSGNEIERCFSFHLNRSAHRLVTNKWFVNLKALIALLHFVPCALWVIYSRHKNTGDGRLWWYVPTTSSSLRGAS